MFLIEPEDSERKKKRNKLLHKLSHIVRFRATQHILNMFSIR